MKPDGTSRRRAYRSRCRSSDALSIMDKSVSGLTVSRFIFWSSFTRLSVLVGVEDEPLVVDCCSAAVMSVTRAGSAFSMDALSADRRILYMASVEVDPELPVRTLYRELSELDEEPPRRLTISAAVPVEVEPVPVDEAEADDCRLLSSDDVRELLMLLMLDMGFLPPPCMLSDGPGNT